MTATIQIRRSLGAIGRSLVIIAIGAALLVALVVVLIALQGRRDEARPTGAALVFDAGESGEAPSPELRARLDHALDLYRRGLVDRVILAGAGTPAVERAAGQAYLAQRGLPESAVLRDSRGETAWEQAQSAAALARAQGIGSLLVVGEPAQMLRLLKITRDVGVEAYGSPANDPALARGLFENARAMLVETGAYLAYVLGR